MYKWQGCVYTKRREIFYCEIGQSALYYGAKNNTVQYQNKRHKVFEEQPHAPKDQDVCPREEHSFSNLNLGTSQ